MGLLDFGKKKKPSDGSIGGTDVPVSQILAMKAQGMNNNQIANQLRASGYSLTQIRDGMAQANIKSAVVPGAEESNMTPGGPVPSSGPEFPAPAQPGRNANMPAPQNRGNLPSMPQTGQPSNLQTGQSSAPQYGEPMENIGEPEGMELPPLPEVTPHPPAFETPQPSTQRASPTPQPSSSGGVPDLGGRPTSSMPSSQRQFARGGFSMEQLVNELQRVIEEIIEEKWEGVEDKLSALDMWKTRIEGRVAELSNKVKETTQRLDSFSKGMAEKTEEYQQTMEGVGTEMEAIEKLMGKLVPSLAEEIKELRSVVDKLKKK